jgi:hypothetical protein
MKKALSAPVRMWQLVLVSVLVAVLTSTAVVSAAPLATGFLAPGTIRMIWAYGTGSAPVTMPADYSSHAVLSTTVVIPAGKVAELMAIGEVDMEGGATTGYQYCFGQYRLDNFKTGAQFKPGNYILEGFNPPANNLSVPINGFIGNVQAGTHTVYMVMQAGYNTCTALNRSMIVFANIH